MTLSINEPVSSCTVQSNIPFMRSHWRATHQARNSFQEKAYILRVVYKTPRKKRAPAVESCCGHGDSRNDHYRFLGFSAKHSGQVIRLYRCSSFDSCTGQDSEKTPRWQPRGCDTQSFRPLVQEEVVSSGREYSPAACVSTLSSQRHPVVRLTRSSKGI